MNNINPYNNFIRQRREEESLWNFIKGNNKEIIKQKIKQCVFTVPVLVKAMNRFKVDLNDNKGFEWQGRNFNTMKSHHVWKWAFKNDFFELEVNIEVPIDIEFQLENSIVQIVFTIDPPIRKKAYCELYNHILTTDHEENMRILLKLIEDFGEKVNEDFKKMK